MSDLETRWLDGAVDPVSQAALAARGLEYRIVAHSDADAEAAWLRAVRRGFLDTEPTPEALAASIARGAYRRLTGVFDPAAPDPATPVATIASWVAELTVPGCAALEACAISAVTVAPTHRRRGIARAMLEGELRAAASAGLPAAMLTVSESQLYGRYGFAAAASSAALRLDVKRASWTGPAPDGRVDFIPRERWRELAPALHERARRRMPGEVAMPTAFWDVFAGTTPDAKDADKLRAVQWADAAGEVQGLALYTVTENHDDFTRSTVDLQRLDAATDDAYAGLWRFFVELDLIGTLRAGELSVDEPLLWMIDDRRAATVTVQDHQYVRLLDVRVALETRRYASAASLTLDVADALGLAAGEWTLVVAEGGAGTVREGAATDAERVALGIRDLSALYLGGVSADTLARAGRVETADPEKATRVFSWPVAPRLSYWY